jgi:hypothetical protein
LRHLKFWRAQWFTDFGQWMLGAREGILGAIPCLACLAVGATVVATNVVIAPPAAEALPRPSTAIGAHATVDAQRLLRSEISARRDATRAATATTRRHATKLARTAPAEESESASAQPATLPTTPEVPGDDQDLPVGNPLPGNGDDSMVDRVRDKVTKVAAELIELPDL